MLGYGKKAALSVAIAPVGTDRILEDVLQAMFHGQATNSNIRVHPSQPHGRDAIGYALADILDNCTERKHYDEAGKGNVSNYLPRHYFRDVGKNAQGRKKGPLPSEGRLAKARDLAKAWQHSALGRYYQTGKCSPPSYVMFKSEEAVCNVTPHSEAASHRNKVVALPHAGTAPSLELHGLVGVLKQQQKKAGGIIKQNTNAVKNLAATQVFPGDNVDEGSSPEPSAKKAKQPAKPAAGVLAPGGGGAWARARGETFGSRAGRRTSMAVAAAVTREREAHRRGGSGRNRITPVPEDLTNRDSSPEAVCRNHLIQYAAD
eukprot:jgi/Tetstr1/428377/TSEL_018411.t1